MKQIINVVCLAIVLGSCGRQDEESFKINNGINISHWLSQSNARGKEREAWFTRYDVAFLASLGYDHLRIPIDEEQMFNEDGQKNAEAFRLLHNALAWCAEFNLRAVVDLHILRSHHFNAEVKPLFTEEAAQEKFYECWRQLSGELKRYPNRMVAYELMNEPVADDPETWNVIVNRCATAVRELEPKRTIVIGSNRWQNFGTVKDLRLPANDPNIIISFHYYEPFLLTHYQASWTSQKNITVPVHYPGWLVAESDMEGKGAEELKAAGQSNREFNIDVIESNFKEVLDVAKKYGLSVYCGEYGCIRLAPYADRVRWYADMNTLFNRHGIARANWDYKGGFGIGNVVLYEDILNAILTK